MSDTMDDTTTNTSTRRVSLGKRKSNGEYPIFANDREVGYIARSGFASGNSRIWRVHIDGVYWRPVRNPATGEPVRGKKYVSNTRGGATGTTRPTLTVAYDLASLTIREHWDAVVLFSTRRDVKAFGVKSLKPTLRDRVLTAEKAGKVIDAARALAVVMPVGTDYCNAGEVAALRAALDAYDKGTT